MATESSDSIPSASIASRSSTWQSSPCSPASCLRRFSKVGRSAHVARQVAQRPGQRHARGDGQSLVERVFAGRQLAAPFDGESQLAQRRDHVILRTFESFETVECFLRDDRRLSDAPGRAAFFDWDPR